ncbi:dUTP diphosphatase [Mycoplasmopsis ciconiae]|uniref:dUTP diphosphatase n=1 Tax=Mycoplasmopsis ciconiae TaxID=561067 RepID=A0ABU7MM37_9BACT|nr:dUTP diphosphatase [Mycoplasmopsis ciconiae]
MNFQNIFNYQNELDLLLHKKAIEINPNLCEKDIQNQKLIALMVEVSEFANEVQSFKYWKQNKNIKLDLVLEEYADVIHFLVSFATSLNVEPVIEPKVFSANLNIQFIQIFLGVAELMKTFNKENLLKVFELVLGVSKIVNITFEMIEESYLKKHQENYNRIINNY